MAIQRTSRSTIKITGKKKNQIERNGRCRKDKKDKNADSGIRDILSGTWTGVFWFKK